MVDAALSPRVATGLRELGFDAVHVRDLGLIDASDDEIVDAARATGRAIISADSDFARILTARRVREPSFILFRSESFARPEAQVAWCRVWLRELESDLLAGAVVSVGRSVRVRRLPV